MLVYKHTETIEWVKNWPTLNKKYKVYGGKTPEFLELRMLNVQCILFAWVRTNREIFKATLMYL